jgi:hypothetical protein
MARPEKNTVEYFPFLCDEGKKMFYIEETYGNDGFSTFIKILRELAKTDFHYLDLSKKTTLMFLSAKCKISTKTLESIINDLVDLDKFDKNLWIENKVIWCQDFIDSIQDAYNKRKNKCITYDGLLQHLCSLGVRKRSKCKTSSTVNPQSKVEYSIIDKNKVNNILLEKETKGIFDIWIDYRKEIKKPIKSEKTKTALAEKIKTEGFEKSKLVIYNSIQNQWQGLFWDKHQNEKEKNFPPKKEKVSAAEILQKELGIIK